MAAIATIAERREMRIAVAATIAEGLQAPVYSKDMSAMKNICTVPPEWTNAVRRDHHLPIRRPAEPPMLDYDFIENQLPSVIRFSKLSE